MKIKKYDRFKRAGEVIEATGLKKVYYAEMSDVFKVIFPRPGACAGEIVIYHKKTFASSGFEKIPRESCPHPLLSEIGAELKSDPEFQEKLIRYVVGVIDISDDEEKNKTFKLFKKHVPIEMIMTLETIIEEA